MRGWPRQGLAGSRGGSLLLRRAGTSGLSSPCRDLSHACGPVTGARRSSWAETRTVRPVSGTPAMAARAGAHPSLLKRHGGGIRTMRGSCCGRVARRRSRARIRRCSTWWGSRAPRPSFARMVVFALRATGARAGRPTTVDRVFSPCRSPSWGEVRRPAWRTAVGGWPCTRSSTVVSARALASRRRRPPGRWRSQSGRLA
jgi:hypothetical protein